MNFDFTERLKNIDSVLESHLPAHDDGSWLKKTFAVDTCVSNSLTDALVMPCRNLLLLGGKRWRPLLMVLCTELALENDKTVDDATAKKILQRSYALTPIVEFVHTASLIHDDIEDSSDMRRGKPSAHIQYGNDIAINAASWLFFHASTCILYKDIYWGNNELFLKNLIYEKLTLELRRLHLGQAMDITWHKNNTLLPTIDEYITMTSLKTGTLASLATYLGLTAGNESIEKSSKMASLASNIGVAFQILDDIKNLTTGNVGKKRGDDIVEGKKSLPVLYHIENNKDDFKLLMTYFEQAKKEGINSSAVESAIELIESGKSIEKAHIKAKELIESSCKTMKELYPKAQTTEIMFSLFESLF